MTAPQLEGAGSRLVFRPARADDAQFLAELAGEAFGTYGDYEAVVAAWAADRFVEATIAVHDDTRVGDLLALAVAARFRGRGLGRALLAHVVERARDVSRRHGIDALRLAVAEGNAVARRLFESAGFSYYEAEGSYPNGQRALHMRLSLPRGGRGGRLI